MNQNIDREVWRRVPSVAGLLASSHGRLMVAPYEAQLPNGGVRQYGGTPTTGQWDGERFVYTLKGRSYKAHALICEAFNGARPEGLVCMHRDENAANNRPTNLEWGTQKQNLNAPGFLAHCRSRTGVRSPTFKARQA